jgi:hypothetical protein
VRALVAATAASFLLLSASALAAPPAPRRAPDLSKITPRTPSRALHAEFIVEVNKLGQVTKADDVKKSGDPTFDAMVYGNSLQAYIRTPAGKAVSGKYRLTYDYSPATKSVRRTVSLVQRGGVDPNAPGAVIVEARKVAKQREKARQQAAAMGNSIGSMHTITTHRHPRH